MAHITAGTGLSPTPAESHAARKLEAIEHIRQARLLLDPLPMDDAKIAARQRLAEAAMWIEQISTFGVLG